MIVGDLVYRYADPTREIWRITRVDPYGAYLRVGVVKADSNLLTDPSRELEFLLPRLSVDPIVHALVKLTPLELLARQAIEETSEPKS